MNSYVVVDIETGPLSSDKLKEIQPEFSTRNKKDPVKVAEEMAEKVAEWTEKAATSPITGKVLAIGYRKDGESFVIGTGTEGDDIQNFWDAVWEPHFSNAMVVGCYIKQFDIPFLVRRSYCLGIRPPKSAAYRWSWDKQVYDIIEIWHLHDKYIRDYVGLDQLAWAFGVQRKNGSGGGFHKLWAEDKAKALDYLMNDLVVTDQVYRRMMSLEKPTPF